jgi:DUF4097 and DUF4098 domain-containing protein YvlB
VSGDVSISEAGARIEVKTVSGDVDMAQTTGDAQVRTVSGDVNLHGFTGNLDVETRSGDVDLAASGPVSGSLSSLSGDIAVALPRDADVVLELSIEDDGDIDVDVNLPHEVLEEREGYMKVQIGAGSRTFKVNTHSADIEVREAEEK